MPLAHSPGMACHAEETERREEGLTSDMVPPQSASMMRPYTTMAAKENQQPNSAERGVNSWLAIGPFSSPSSTGRVEVVVIRFASKNRFKMGYPCAAQNPLRPRTCSLAGASYMSRPASIAPQHELA